MALRIIFMGTPAFAVPSLEALIADDDIEVLGVLSQPDRPAGRGNKLAAPPVKRCALEAGLPVYQPQRLRKEPELIAWIEAQQPDFLVTAAFGQILPQAVLDIPRFGTVNVHASLLPRYRGANPIQWAILNGDTQAGITTMLTVLAVDAGPMLEQAAISVDPDESAGHLTERLAQLGAATLPGSLHKLAKGHISPRKQEADSATHAPKLTKEDAVIDWTQNAQAIHNKIRGQQPWPGALTWLNGLPVKIISSHWVANSDASDKLPPPGTIVRVESNGLMVQTGCGLLSITCLQSQGKPKLLARDWANGALSGLAIKCFTMPLA